MKNLDKLLKTIIKFQDEISDFELKKNIRKEASGGAYSYNKEITEYNVILRFDDDTNS